MNGLCAIFGAALSWWSACAAPHPGEFDPTRLGYAETTAGRSLVSEAIGKANIIVDKDERLALVAGWEQSAWTADSVPVHLIVGGSSNEMIFVPKGCRCVVITVLVMQTWLAEASDPAKADLAVDGVSILVFMMLHELGHIACGDEGVVAFAPLPKNASDTNLVRNDEKRREFAADAWAADHVRRAFTAGHPGFFASMNVQFALTAVGWNLARRRMIDNFGASVLRDPRVFFDQGYTHPNFELRMLVANELVSGTPAAKALRQEFESMREKGDDLRCPV
jgi:hypothetical protein